MLLVVGLLTVPFQLLHEDVNPVSTQLLRWESLIGIVQVRSMMDDFNTVFLRCHNINYIIPCRHQGAELKVLITIIFVQALWYNRIHGTFAPIVRI